MVDLAQCPVKGRPQGPSSSLSIAGRSTPPSSSIIGIALSHGSLGWRGQRREEESSEETKQGLQCLCPRPRAAGRTRPARKRTCERCFRTRRPKLMIPGNRWCCCSPSLSLPPTPRFSCSGVDGEGYYVSSPVTSSSCLYPLPPTGAAERGKGWRGRARPFAPDFARPLRRCPCRNVLCPPRQQTHARNQP